MLIKVYSVLETLGTSMLWVEGEISSNFLPVKICHFHIKNHFTQLSVLSISSVLFKKEPARHAGRMLFDAEERRNETHVDGDQVDLGVTVLSGLGGGHLFSPTHPSCSHHIRTEPNPGQYVVVQQYRYEFVFGIDCIPLEFKVFVVVDSLLWILRL